MWTTSGPVQEDREGASQTGPNRFGLSALAPMVLGFVAPLIALVLVDPALLRDGREFLVALLLVVMFVASALFAYGVFMPKNLTTLRVNPAGKAVEMVYSNALAEEVDSIAFAQIADIRAVRAYDRDGYSAARHVIVQRNGDQISLPAGVVQGNLEQIRRLVGIAA